MMFEEAAALRDKVNRIREEHLTSGEAMAESEMKTAFKPVKRPRKKEGVFG